MMSTTDAFLLGWKCAREAGQLAQVMNRNISVHAVFSEMTLPSRETAQAIILSETPAENKPLGEYPIG